MNADKPFRYLTSAEFLSSPLVSGSSTLDHVMRQLIWRAKEMSAAKFTRKGGRIEVATRAEDTHAVITVKDSGIGLPADANNRIFDLFVQLNASHGGGLGIGLNLTRSIVEMGCGLVEAESGSPDHGATFRVRLPLAARPEAEPRAAATLSLCLSQ